MKKIIINKSFGGFWPSKEAVKLYAAKKGKECYFFEFSVTGKYTPLKGDTLYWVACSVPDPNEHLGEYTEIKCGEEQRADPDLVAVVEELGSKLASDEISNLKVVEIPDDVEYYVEEDRGMECIHERHRTWK